MNNSEKQDYRTESDFINDEPSGMVKNMLSMAAKVMISTSKKVINKVVSNYRPSMTLSSLQNEDIIKIFINKSTKYNVYDETTLREIALNNINTIGIANKINEKLLDIYNEKVENFKKKFSQEENSVKYNSMMEDLKEMKIHLDEGSEFMLKYSIIESIKNNNGDNSIITHKIENLNTKYPNWSNPVIAEYYIKFAEKISDKKKCLSILLFYYPTNTLYLKMAKEIENSTSNSVFDQLIMIF